MVFRSQGRCLSVESDGLITLPAVDLAHGNVVTTGASAGVIDTADLLIIMQQVLAPYG